MRRLLSTSVFFLLLMILSGVGGLEAQPHEMEGTWEIYWENRLGTVHSFMVTLEEDGQMLEGSAEIPRAFFTEEAQPGTEEFMVTDADSHGNMLTFKIQLMHPHHRMMQAPEENPSGPMHPHTIALYGAVGDTEMEGYMTGVMPEPETAVPFEGRKRY